MLSEKIKSTEEIQNYELEDQVILRLPKDEANELRRMLKSKPKKVKKSLKIILNNDMRGGKVYCNKKVLDARIFDLPCHVESLKTTDRGDFYKTADVSKIIVCKEGAFDGEDETKKENLNESLSMCKKTLKKYLYPHGLTPPLKNVKKRRFRKVLKNRNDDEDADEIEKEVLWLLRMDMEAVSSRYEFFYENNNIPKNKYDFNEQLLFGEISDLFGSDEENNSSTSLELAPSKNYL